MKTHGQQKICKNTNFQHIAYLLVHINSVECGNTARNGHENMGSLQIFIFSAKTLENRFCREKKCKHVPIPCFHIVYLKKSEEP